MDVEKEVYIMENMLSEDNIAKGISKNDRKTSESNG
jgi:hypothetical protein